MQLSYFQGPSELLTGISFEIHWFGISKLEEIFLDFSEQELGNSRFLLKREFSTFLNFSELNYNWKVSQQHSFQKYSYSTYLLFKNAFTEDWPQDFEWLVECGDSFCFLFPLFLVFRAHKRTNEQICKRTNEPFQCQKDWINEFQSIDWTLVCTLIFTQYFCNNNDLNLNKLMQDQGHIKTQPN